jgi:hypothetical protein
MAATATPASTSPNTSTTTTTTQAIGNATASALDPTGGLFQSILNGAYNAGAQTGGNIFGAGISIPNYVGVPSSTGVNSSTGVPNSVSS